MHWFGLALLAFVLGYVNAYISPKITAAIPANAQQSRLAQAFFNGAIILLAVFIAAFLLRVIGVRTVERG